MTKKKKKKGRLPARRGDAGQVPPRRRRRDC